MSECDDEQEAIDATEEQLAVLVAFGVPEIDLENLSFSEAEQWIDQLREERVRAERFQGPA